MKIAIAASIEVVMQDASSVTRSLSKFRFVLVVGGQMTDKQLYIYKERLYHWVGEHYCGGVTKVMLLPIEIEHLHLNHEHLIQIPDDDPDLIKLEDD